MRSGTPLTKRQASLRRGRNSGAVLSLLPVHAAGSPPDFNGIWGKYTYNYPKPYMKGRDIADGYNNEYLMPCGRRGRLRATIW